MYCLKCVFVCSRSRCCGRVNETGACFLHRCTQCFILIAVRQEVVCFVFLHSELLFGSSLTPTCKFWLMRKSYFTNSANTNVLSERGGGARQRHSLCLFLPSLWAAAWFIYSSVWLYGWLTSWVWNKEPGICKWDAAASLHSDLVSSFRLI